MSIYYEIKADIDGDTHTLFGSYDISDCTAEKRDESHNWKAEGFKKIRIEAREEEEKPDPEIYGDDIDPNTGEIRAEIEEEFTEEEEEALESARAEGYSVDGELARLYLDMDYANSYMLMVTDGMSAPLKHPSYKDAKAAWRAYWNAVDGKHLG